MEKDKKGNKEPYRPEDTPKPPQQINPDARTKDPDKIGNSSHKKGPDKNDSGTGRHHLLDDQADIDDETTL